MNVKSSKSIYRELHSISIYPFPNSSWEQLPLGSSFKKIFVYFTELDLSCGTGSFIAWALYYDSRVSLVSAHGLSCP